MGAEAQSAMASFAVGFYDREFNNYDAIAYGLSRDIVGVYEKPLHLILDAIFYYPHPVSDSDSPPQERSGYGSIFWPQEVEEHDLTNRAALGDDEEKQQPYNGGSNWLSEYDPSIYQCWGKDFQFCGRGTDDNGYSGGLEKTEDSYHGGEEYDSYYKEVEKQPAYDNYGPWSSYGSLFGCGAEEDFYESNWQEPKLTQSFPDELGIYQGIFGYRPCFFQKDQKNYGEQEAYDHGNPWKGTADYLFGNSFRW